MGRRPANASGERARQRAIRQVDLEDARPVFERIARSAQRIGQAPIAHVSIVGPTDIWIAGVSEGQVPVVSREDSFVRYALEGDGVMWIENLADDRRFDGNSFVYGDSHFRCYVGAPVIVSDGSCVGTLTLIYREPRPYDPELAEALEDLAALVAQEWERRRAMKALKKSEANARAAKQVLEHVIETAPVALVMTDRKLRVLQTSYRWRHEMLAEHLDVRGRNIYEIFPEARERWGALLDRALNGETIRSRQAQFYLPSGAEPWVRAEITPWHLQNGRIGGLLIMTYDITDMVDALETMRRSEQTLKLALEIGELSMWEMDHRDKQVNSAGRSLTREGAEARDYEDMNANIWYGIHPHDLPDARAAWDRYELEGTPFRAVFRMMQHDGPHFWVQSATEVIRGEDGKAERTVGVLRNIDKQKRSEIALAKARDAAEAANRAKSEFLANMSHEIRTPLNGVMGVASALARSRLDSNQREMVSLIESSAKTLESLLSDVLDLARVESGRLELAHEPFEPSRCIADVAALFHPSAEAKSLNLIVEEAPGLEGAFMGDASRVRQVLSNLVANAVKFTPAGEVRIGASALRTPDGVKARIWVRDTGIGFDEEVKARLFSRFEQADGSITRRYGGTGLGLAISRSLVELMGGGLEATATPGEGATFTLTLPLARAESAPVHAFREAETDPTVDERPPLKVLLAEDHPTNRRVVQLILEAIGVDLTSVENGALAVEAWEQGDFDLVLMDMQMPVMDGLTAMREIRARERAQGRAPIQIFALTANAMPDHAEASRQAGADGHLTKPITADALIRAVERAGATASAAERKVA